MNPSDLVRAAVVRIKARVALLQARRHTLRNLNGRRGDRVLVICHGNIYRSPFVAEYLRAHLGDAVRSAGFHPVADRPSPARHLQMSRELGVNLDDHRSAVVRPEDVAWADLIVLMDRYNWVRLQRLNPAPGKIIWLGALTTGSPEIPDPYGLDDEASRGVLARLQEGARKLAAGLKLRQGDGTSS